MQYVNQPEMIPSNCKENRQDLNESHEINTRISPPTTNHTYHGGLHPLDLLPLEMWNEIFIRLPNVDIITCFHTTKIWKEYLGGSHWNWPHILFSEIFCHLPAYLNQNELLTCRLVSGGWKTAVDAWIKGVSCQEFSRKSYAHQLVETSVNNCDKVDACLALKPFRAPPLLGRINFVSCPRGEDYWSKVMQLLFVHGKHIRCCTLILTMFERTDEILRMALVHMPNLKRLALRCYMLPCNYMIDADGVHGMVEIDESRTLRTKIFFREHPLPDLPHLTNLHVDRMPIVYQRLFLGKYGTQLKRVNLLLNSMQAGERWNVPELEHLSISVKSPDQLRQCGWTESRLKSLHLKLLECSNPNLESLVDTLNMFESTLKELRLSFWKVNNDLTDQDKEVFCNFKLPFLEVLHFENYIGPVTFLKTLKSLKTFKSERLRRIFYPSETDAWNVIN